MEECEYLERQVRVQLTYFVRFVECPERHSVSVAEKIEDPGVVICQANLAALKSSVGRSKCSKLPNPLRHKQPPMSCND
eukprot:41593-Eustigmatos_ZCMA.PRE.1